MNFSKKWVCLRIIYGIDINDFKHQLPNDNSQQNKLSYAEILTNALISKPNDTGDSYKSDYTNEVAHSIITYRVISIKDIKVSSKILTPEIHPFLEFSPTSNSKM